MIIEFKVGGLYSFSCAEHLYMFIDRRKEKYTSDEICHGYIELVSPGTILTYIKSVIEIDISGEFKMPIFYFEDGLVIPYSPYDILIGVAAEVVDSGP